MDSPYIGTSVPDWTLRLPIDKQESTMKSMRTGLALAKNAFEVSAVDYQGSRCFARLS